MWVVLLLLAAGRRAASTLGPVAELPGGEWVWPMLTLPDGRQPVITSGWGSPRGDNGVQGPHRHVGVDIMYKRPIPFKGKVKYPMVDHGSKGHEVPQGTPVVAAHAGRIWSTGKTPLGHFVLLDHGPEPWATFYQHLEELTVPPHHGGKQVITGAKGLEIAAGTPLGIAGYGQGGQEIRHLHFELRRGKTRVDPEPIMKNWRKL